MTPARKGVAEPHAWSTWTRRSSRRVLAKILDERVPQRIRHPLAVALSRRPPLCFQCRRPGVTASAICRPSPHRHVRRQLPTGAGPSGLPVNALIIRAFGSYSATSERFTWNVRRVLGGMNLFQVAEEIGRRLVKTSSSKKEWSPSGLRGTTRFQEDRTGAITCSSSSTSRRQRGGLGPTNQTGWTGVDRRAACIVRNPERRHLCPGGKKAYFGHDGRA